MPRLSLPYTLWCDWLIWNGIKFQFNFFGPRKIYFLNLDDICFLLFEDHMKPEETKLHLKSNMKYFTWKKLNENLKGKWNRMLESYTRVKKKTYSNWISFCSFTHNVLQYTYIFNSASIGFDLINFFFCFFTSLHYRIHNI